GLGAIGRHVGDWVAACGAKYLVLVSRSASDHGDGPYVESLRQLGIHVIVQSADVAQFDEVGRIIAEVARVRPLKGVFHLAGAVADAGVLQLTPERFDATLGGKAEGAWNLHQA